MITITAAFTEFLENLKGQSFCNRRNYKQRLAGFLASYGHSTKQHAGMAPKWRPCC